MAKVFGIHYISLRRGVQMADFEAFLKRATPLVPPWPGVRHYVGKGDRGDRVGRLILIIEYESVEVRNHYFPDGAPSPAAQQHLDAMADFIAEWQQYASFPNESVLWTDYVVISEVKGY